MARNRPTAGEAGWGRESTGGKPVTGQVPRQVLRISNQLTLAVTHSLTLPVLSE